LVVKRRKAARGPHFWYLS